MPSTASCPSSPTSRRIPASADPRGPPEHGEDELLAEGLDEAKVDGGGLKIISTIDFDAQQGAIEAAEASAKSAAAERGKDWKQLHPAIASVDTSNGAILALYGGCDYVEDTRTGRRPPRDRLDVQTWALVAALRDGSGSTPANGNELDDGAGKINNAGGGTTDRSPDQGHHELDQLGVR